MSFALELLLAATLASLAVSGVMVCIQLQRIARALEALREALPQAPLPVPEKRGSVWLRTWQEEREV